MHISSIHDQVKYECNKCEYKATQRSHLTQHVRSIHDQFKYDCKNCEYKATFVGSLRTHMKAKYQKNDLNIVFCPNKENKRNNTNNY